MKGYLKIRISVNIKTKETVALGVTNDTVQYGRILSKMVNHVLHTSDWKIEAVLVDGAYDTNSILGILK